MAGVAIAMQWREVHGRYFRATAHTNLTFFSFADYGLDTNAHPALSSRARSQSTRNGDAAGQNISTWTTSCGAAAKLRSSLTHDEEKPYPRQPNLRLSQPLPTTCRTYWYSTIPKLEDVADPPWHPCPSAELKTLHEASCARYCCTTQAGSTVPNDLGALSTHMISSLGSRFRGPTGLHRRARLLQHSRKRESSRGSPFAAATAGSRADRLQRRRSTPFRPTGTRGRERILAPPGTLLAPLGQKPEPTVERGDAV